MYHQQFSIYWFDPEPSKGAELKKIRPCIVISPDEMNRQLRTVLVIPVTSTMKPWPFRPTIHIAGYASSAACDQLRVADKTRLKEMIGVLKDSERQAVLQVMRDMLA